MRELCPNIYDFCDHWLDAPVVGQTLEALELVHDQQNDGIVCAAKAMVECACKTIVEELDDPSNPLKDRPRSPIQKEQPSLGNWLSAATTLLELTHDKHDAFNKVVGQYNELATTLGKFRNTAGTISHGRMGFEDRLSTHHRRAALITADTIIGFLHDAYVSGQTDPVSTFEPYERFEEQNAAVDKNCAFVRADLDYEDGILVAVLRTTNGDELQFLVPASQFLFGIDREAYKAILLQEEMELL